MKCINAYTDRESMRLYLSRGEQYAVAVLLLAIVGALLVLSYAYGRQEDAQNDELAFLQQAEQTPPADTAIVVHVAGAVKSPGVYTCQPGERIFQAIERAGGSLPHACLDAINLAAHLEDGQQIFVPAYESATPAPAGVAVAPSTSPTPGRIAGSAGASRQVNSMPAVTPAGPVKINLNTATVGQLDTLPGIGPVTAQHIIDYRSQHDRFKDMAELLNIEGIGPKTYEKITPYLTL